MRFLQRMLGRDPQRDEPFVLEKRPQWRPLYYPEGATRPQPYPGALGTLTSWDLPTPFDCLKHGLEAWLGLNALRKQGCQTCAQCTQPTASLILEFYSAATVEQPDVTYIGAYWWRTHAYEPDQNRLIPWRQPDGSDVFGNFAYTDSMPVMKSLHFHDEEGRIFSQWGNIAPETQGDQSSQYGQGLLDGIGGGAIHSSLRLPEFLQKQGMLLENRPPVAIVDWNPENIIWGIGAQIKTDRPNTARWAYPDASFRLPNRWLQEHP